LFQSGKTLVPLIVARIDDFFHKHLRDARINFTPLQRLPAAADIVNPHKILDFSGIGEEGDSPNKLKCCWRHKKTSFSVLA